MDKKLLKERESYKIFNWVYENEWKFLKSTPDNLFENSEYNLNTDWEYDRFINSDEYKLFLESNSKTEKIKIIKDYFYKKTILPLVEQIETQLKNLEDITFPQELLIESTLEIIEKKSFNDKEKETLKFIEEALGFDNLKNITKSTLYSAVDIFKILANDIIPLFLFGITFGSANNKLILNLFIDINKYFNTKFDLKNLLKGNEDQLKEMQVNLSEIQLKCANAYRFYQIIPKSDFKIIEKLFHLRNEIISNMIKKNEITSLYYLKKAISESIKDPNKAKLVYDYFYCIHSNIIDNLLGYLRFSFENEVIETEVFRKLKPLIKNKNQIKNNIQSIKNLFNLSHNIDKTNQKIILASLILFEYYKILDYFKRQNFNMTLTAQTDFIKKLSNKVASAFDELYLLLDEYEQYQKTGVSKSNSDNKNNDNKPKKESLFDI